VEFDWTTFSLEIVNFLILVWILKHFLYRPILGVLAKRRAGIEKSLADAKRIEAEATALKAQNDERLAQWEEEKEGAQARLVAEIAAERARLMAGLEASLAEEREKRKALNERREKEWQRSVEERAILQAGAFASALLSRLASVGLEESLFQMVLDDLGALAGSEREAVVAAAKGNGKAQIQSAFSLNGAQRQKLERVLGEIAGTPVATEYSENADLVAGIRISIGPWILHANLRDELKFFTGAGRRAG
jgi:F-type H+-transporting ATPase subunit b